MFFYNYKALTWPLSLPYQFHTPKRYISALYHQTEVSYFPHFIIGPRITPNHAQPNPPPPTPFAVFTPIHPPPHPKSQDPLQNSFSSELSVQY